MKSYKNIKHKRNKKYSIKKRYKNLQNSNTLLLSFQKEITIRFLEMLLMIKLFHWKTFSYATHKATDQLYEKLNENMDSFIEILLGKTGFRTNLINVKNIELIDLKNKNELKNKIMNFKIYLMNLNDNKAMKLMLNTDLYNIRDTILGDLNQFLYLLTFN